MTEAGLPARTLVLASGNSGKLKELAAMLTPLGWDIAPQGDWNVAEAVEDGMSFVENALIKARHASGFTGLPALADDSGLVVDALDGAPGIFSARFAGAGASAGRSGTNTLALSPPERRTSTRRSLATSAAAAGGMRAFHA